MTALAQLRKTALSNPEAVADPSVGEHVFTVGGKEFASLDSDAKVRLRLRLPTAEAEDLVAQFAEAERAA